MLLEPEPSFLGQKTGLELQYQLYTDPSVYSKLRAHAKSGGAWSVPSGVTTSPAPFTVVGATVWCSQRVLARHGLAQVPETAEAALKLGAPVCAVIQFSNGQQMLASMGRHKEIFGAIGSKGLLSFADANDIRTYTFVSA